MKTGQVEGKCRKVGDTWQASATLQFCLCHEGTIGLKGLKKSDLLENHSFCIFILRFLRFKCKIMESISNLEDG